MEKTILTYPFKETSFACFTDLHLESTHHQRSFLVRDLEEAAGMNARFFLGSDIWSLIGQKDKRYNVGNDTVQVTAYVNQIVEQAYELLKKYADRIDIMFVGNHESSFIKNTGFDPTLLLISMLNNVRSKKLKPIIYAGYKAFFRLRFQERKHIVCDDWLFFHGKGGSAPVTRGALDFSRIARDHIADVYWMGHKHTEPSDSIPVRYLSKNGYVKQKKRLLFYTAGYDSKIVENTYDKTGYVPDWANENFITNTSWGNAIVKYNVRQVDSHDMIERWLIRRN